MAIVTNIDVVNAYDQNLNIQSSRILPDEMPDNDEHAAQCLCVETLRTLLAMGITVQEYNDMDDPTWQNVIIESYNRSRLNINAPAAILIQSHREAAAGLGGNFFEHEYTTIMAGIQQTEKISFTRVGGL